MDKQTRFLSARTHRRAWAVAASSTIVVSGCIISVITEPCASHLGECPAPDPGLLIDELGLQKSVWHETQEFGPADPFYSQLCTADLRPAPGQELILSGMDGFDVIEVADGAPSTVVRVPWHDAGFRSYIEYHDMDGDGHAEFFATNGASEPPNTEFYSADGSLILRYPTFQTSFEAIDLRGDGEWELVVFDYRDRRMSIWTMTGDLIFEIDELGDVSAADLNADGELDIILLMRDPVEQGILTLSSWQLDGTRLGSFQAQGSRHDVFVAALAEDPARHYLGHKCQLFTPDGVLVSDRELVNWIPVRNGVTTPFVEPSKSLICADFASADSRFDPNTQIDIRPTCHDDIDGVILDFVLFRPEERPYRIEFTYTVMQESHAGFFQNTVDYDVTRTILRIFNTNNRLVHHEVLETSNGRGSYAVIESADVGRQMLLLADGHKIWAYHLDD